MTIIYTQGWGWLVRQCLDYHVYILWTTKVKQEKSFAAYRECRKNFCGFTVSKVLPLLKAFFIRKTFAIHRKSAKTVKLFSSVDFDVYI